MDLFHFFVEGVDWKSTLFGAVIGSLVSMLIQVIIKIFKPIRNEYHISLLKRGEEQCFSSISGDDISIEVNYQGEKLLGDISLLEIELYNDGKNAISFANHFNRPIYLKSDNYKIIKVKAIDASSVGAIITEKEDGTVCISWDLLKRHESIRLQLIGQRKESVSAKKKNELSPFYESLKFSVRSDCVDYLVSGGMPIRNMMSFTVLGIVIIACLHIFLFEEPETKDYSFRINNEIMTGILAYDEDNDIFYIQQLDSIPKSDHFSLKKHQKVNMNVQYLLGRTEGLILNYLGFIVLMLLFGLIISISNKRYDKRKAFEE